MVKKLLLFSLLVFVAACTLIIPHATKTNAMTYTETLHPEYEVYNFYDTYYGMRLDYNLPEGTHRIKVQIPETTYNTTDAGSVDSKIIFYTGDDQTGDDATILFDESSDIDTLESTGFTYDLQDYALGEINSISIRIMQTWSTQPTGYFTSWQEQNTLTLNIDDTMMFWEISSNSDKTTISTSEDVLGSRGFYLDLPQISYYLSGYNSEKSRIVITNGSSDTFTYTFTELFGSDYYTEQLHVIYSQLEGFTGSAYTLDIYIQTDRDYNTTDPEDTFPIYDGSPYLTWLTENSSLFYDYSGYYDTDVYWTNYNFFSNFYGLRAEIDVPADMQSLVIDVPESNHHELSYGGVESTITLYDNSDTSLGSYALDNIGSFSEGLYQIVPSELGLDIGDIAYIHIKIMQNYTFMPSGYIDYMNTNTALLYDESLVTAEFYSDGSLYDTVVFVDDLTMPADPTPATTNLTFEGWRMYNGDDYVDGMDLQSYTIDGIVRLYATYSISGSYPYTPTDPAIEDNNILTILAGFGLDDTVGRVFVWLMATIGVFIALALMNMPIMGNLIANLIVTSLFVTWGFLPLFLVILVYAMYATMFIVALRSDL